MDLRAFYDANGPYFWSLYAVVVALSIANNVGGRAALGLSVDVLSYGPNLVLIALFVALARFRHRALHGVAVVVLLALFLAQWASMSVGAV